jgi:hypothetical protein
MDIKDKKNITDMKAIKAVIYTTKSTDIDIKTITNTTDILAMKSIMDTTAIMNIIVIELSLQ